ncbi:MAG TPA: hypothetical protein VGJ77_00380 [Gaiellaceae bacterium]
METGAPHLRPLGIGEVLDVALKIVWRNAVTLFKIVFFVVFPVQVISAVVQLSAIPERDEVVDDKDVAALIGAFGVTGILGWVASTLAAGACYRAIASAYLGERTDWRPSLEFALRRLRSILWVTILAGLAALLGLILCVIPGIYLWVVFALAVPVLLTEDKRGTKALGRSRDLVRGYWWRTFAIVLLGTILASIIGAVIGGVVGSTSGFDTTPTDLTSGVLSVVAGTVSDVITTPFTAAFVTVLYFDLRVRKEAFDLQLLAERIGVEPAGGALGPRPGDRPEIPGEEQPPFWPPPPGWKPGGADGSGS